MAAISKIKIQKIKKEQERKKERKKERKRFKEIKKKERRPKPISFDPKTSNPCSSFLVIGRDYIRSEISHKTTLRKNKTFFACLSRAQGWLEPV